MIFVPCGVVSVNLHEEATADRHKATTDHHCDFAGSGNINGWRQGDQLIICSGWCTWNDVLRWCNLPKDLDDMWNVVLRWCHLSTDLAKSNPGGFWWNLVGARQNLLVGNWNNSWNSNQGYIMFTKFWKKKCHKSKWITLEKHTHTHIFCRINFNTMD